jgi:hypothetical protein
LDAADVMEDISGPALGGAGGVIAYEPQLKDTNFKKIRTHSPVFKLAGCTRSTGIGYREPA